MVSVKSTFTCFVLTETYRYNYNCFMAHRRLRFLEKQLKESLSWPPSVSLVGMRQTGKTTLIKKTIQ